MHGVRWRRRPTPCTRASRLQPSASRPRMRSAALSATTIGVCATARIPPCRRRHRGTGPCSARRRETGRRRGETTARAADGRSPPRRRKPRLTTALPRRCAAQQPAAAPIPRLRPQGPSSTSRRHCTQDRCAVAQSPDAQPGNLAARAARVILAACREADQIDAAPEDRRGVHPGRPARGSCAAAALRISTMPTTPPNILTPHNRLRLVDGVEGQVLSTAGEGSQEEAAAPADRHPETLSCCRQQVRSRP